MFLNRLIRWSLANRSLVVMVCIIVLLLGLKAGKELPVEVLPDLTKPTVTVMVETPGMAPEEVEDTVTAPLERSLQGIAGLTRLRTTSDIALTVVFAEFEWGTDIYRARQFVQERIQSVDLPKKAQPYLTPVTSLMGEILLIGIKSQDGKVAPMDLRSIADWTVRRRLQAIPGIAEILNMGGGVKQAQIQPDPMRMQAYNVTLEEMVAAAKNASNNTTGGFLTQSAKEVMVRNLAMTTDLGDIAGTVIKMVNDRPVCIKDVADVVWAPEPMRGTASVNGSPGVIMSVTKAPGFDTIALTEKIEQALAELRPSLAQGVEVTVLFRQRDFIDRSIGNLSDAIRDGAIMVCIVLFLFLFNMRTTVITLTAMPLSFAITLIVFKWMGMSVNSMTLGGLAVAIGMVVDDAIVDVENVYRRLKVNASLPNPKPKLEAIAAASSEVRNSIFYATILIVLVLLPLLGLAGIEGRLFSPIAMATIISMLASFFVSLTAIPVLCSLLLKDPTKQPLKAGVEIHHDGWMVRMMKWVLKHTLLRFSLAQPVIVMILLVGLFGAVASLYPKMGKDFLPAFNEETMILTTGAGPGTSMVEMEKIANSIEQQLRKVPEINHIGRRIGRAERSDHIVPMSNVEFDLDFKMDRSNRKMADVLADIRNRVKTIPGSFSVLAGPLSHRINHLLSGVTSPVAIKIFGSDLEVISGIGKQVQAVAKTIPGLEDARLDTQAMIPQLRIEPDRARAQAYGVQPGAINDTLSTLLGGDSISVLRDGQILLDLTVRLSDEWRENPEKIKLLPIATMSGKDVPLSLVADIREGAGANNIFRENGQRRFVVSIKPTQRDVNRLVEELKSKIQNEVKPPQGVYIQYEGEFEAEQAASRRIWMLFGLVLVVMALLLRTYFQSMTLTMLVLVNIPLAFIGSLYLTWRVVDNISIATLVGLIAVGGVAARNGIMMISHYLHLMKHEGEEFGKEMIIRGTLERFLPVVMTALSAGIALIPLAMADGQPGKEILHPVAVCIVGGLISSTFLDFAVTPAMFWLFGGKASKRVLAGDSPSVQ